MKDADTTPRVLHVVAGMNVGGAETMLMNLYRAVDRTRLQFDFLVFTEKPCYYDEEILALGGRLLRQPPPKRQGPVRAVRGMASLMRQFGPFAAVHSHILHASALALSAAAAAGIRIRIAHSHNTSDVEASGLRRAYQTSSRLVQRLLATQYVACGMEAGQYQFGPAFRRHGQVIRNSVDIAQLQASATSPSVRASIRADLQVSEHQLLLGSVARLEPVKNHQFLLHLLRLALDIHLPVRLALAGDGSLRTELEREAERLRVQEHVAFLGLRSDVPDLLAAFDALLLPSHYEGLPVVLVEAQAAGVPSLVSAAVSREADLGLGLLDFLNLEDTGAWLAALENLPRERPDWDYLRAGLAAKGYEVSNSVESLYQLYGIKAA